MKKLKKIIYMALLIVTCLTPIQTNAFDGRYTWDVNGQRVYDIYYWEDGPILFVFYQDDTITYVWVPNIGASNDQCRRWSIPG